MREFKVAAPTKMSLLKEYHKISKQEKNRLSKDFNEKKDREIKNLFITRPVRSLSGIVNVSVLTKPYPCPGECIYCPNEKDMPKSYIKSEPAAMRAAMNNFDPKKQVNTRIESLKLTGHPVDKIELRIIGGTWSFYSKKYQEDFIKKCFDSCNKKDSKNIKEAQKINGKSKNRVVGLSIETRPDFITEKEIKKLRYFGVTAVELGVQAIDNNILKKVKRGHEVDSTHKATKLLKDAGFKVCYQMMPNLPGSTIKKDKEMFRELFSNEKFQPDYLKIYPTMTIKGTKMYLLYKKGEYLPYSDNKLKSLLKEIKKEIPIYVRIQRLIRDIPAQSIEAGTRKSNMREIIAKESKDEGWSCRCIRCREVRSFYETKEKVFLFRKDYNASQGKEVFLSFENKDQTKLFSLLRLRIPSSETILTKNCSIIREVHTYGQQLQVKDKKNNSPQHKGMGKKLIKEAEKISINEFNIKKIAVISAIGTRSYYRKLGYRLNNSYMVKKLK